MHGNDSNQFLSKSNQYILPQQQIKAFFGLKNPARSGVFWKFFLPI
jgi:hypothetical protein